MNKPFREDFYRSSRRNLQQENMPSFSSTLLDEIYRSIDGNADKRQGGGGGCRGFAREDEGRAGFGRACLVDRWMEKEKKEAKTRAPSSLQDNDLIFFSSTSSSSDSSGALSSSDTEFFGSTTTAAKPKVSCFSTRPKPIRTGASDKHRDLSLLHDYNNHGKSKGEDDLMKSKSRALKIYANLKKVKQPISPGGRLTSFINSLFTTPNGKKSKNNDKKVLQDLKSPKAPSACSSASSFSRSCLSKYSPKSREKMRSADQRTVRFHPVSVIVDEDSRPCGTRPLPPNVLTEVKLNNMEKNRKFEGLNSKRVDEFSVLRKIHDEDDDDCLSDSSSDLFELDHLALFGDNRFCEELPVYETTHFDTNRAIASGLIR